ncbi:DUF7147 family protein [Aquibacillus sediminis]|uniref:DUF7147 family protein n=1 Tax=Aquibacillus sediminis TaxID=2574734 RepID=UPI00110881BB|nr:methylthioribose kinase [Aquibacillus sediminis]
MQRFIELGEGYGDIYELIELARHMPDRLEEFIKISTTKNDTQLLSFAIIMKPTDIGDFQPIYISLEGVPVRDQQTSKRLQLFEKTARDHNHTVKELTVKPSTSFHEKMLYYQYLIGIFRMNRFIR